MPDSLVVTCPEHGLVLQPIPGVVPPALTCPGVACMLTIVVATPGEGEAPPSPLTYLEQGAAERHELVLSHEAAGFSRSEAMQILCCVVYASIMKDKGSG